MDGLTEEQLNLCVKNTRYCRHFVIRGSQLDKLCDDVALLVKEIRRLQEALTAAARKGE